MSTQKFILNDPVSDMFNESIVNEVPDADNTFKYIREWEIECGQYKKVGEKVPLAPCKYYQFNVISDALYISHSEDYRVLTASHPTEFERYFIVTTKKYEYLGVTDDFNNAHSIADSVNSVEQEKTADNLDSLKIQAQKKLNARSLIVSLQSLKEQTLDGSAAILQHSLGNMMFCTPGSHPISDATIHIQLDSGDELDINFWSLLGAFKTNDPDQIDDKLCAALFHHGKIDGKRLSSVQLIKGKLHFTI